MAQAHIGAHPNAAYSPTDKSGTLEAELGVGGNLLPTLTAYEASHMPAFFLHNIR